MVQENPTTLLVVAAALIAPDGTICLQQRPRDKAHGGLWEFPGGKVERHESPESALVREIAEELGVTLDPAALVPAGFASDPGDGAAGGRPLVILLYTCREWRGAVRCLEGEAIAWLRPDAIAALAMPPLDYPLAEQLRQRLSAPAN